MCEHEDWTWSGKPIPMIGQGENNKDEVYIPIKCDDCGKKGYEVLECKEVRI